MKKILFMALAAFGLVSSMARADVQIGKPAPDYSFSDINGTKYSIAGLKGKTVVLEWNNPECPFVKAFYDAGVLQSEQAAAVKDPNVVWISVNSGYPGQEGAYNAADIKKWLAAKKWSGSAYILDPQGVFGRLYDAKTTPHLFVIDQGGNVAYQGAIDSIKSLDQADIKKADYYVPAALAALAKGEQPKVTSTQPFGCGVKYKPQ